MRTFVLAGAATLALAFAGAGASAEGLSGTIQRIEPNLNRITVNDRIFTVSPSETVGPSIDQLREGDRVEVIYSKIVSEGAILAMQVRQQ